MTMTHNRYRLFSRYSSNFTTLVKLKTTGLVSFQILHRVKRLSPRNVPGDLYRIRCVLRLLTSPQVKSLLLPCAFGKSLENSAIRRSALNLISAMLFCVFSDLSPFIFFTAYENIYDSVFSGIYPYPHCSQIVVKT